MRRWILLLLLLVVACGADDKKKKKAKKPKVVSPAKRAERACEATCARSLRCDEEEEVDPCMKACRVERTRHMHIYRTRFVFAYADCLDRLPCGKDVGRCQAVAVAAMMEPPEDPDEEKKADDKAKKGDDKKKKPKEKKKKKKKKKNKEAEKKRKKQIATAADARALYEQCHDRRLACDGAWNDRCNAAGALTDGGRERVRECLSLPCDAVRRCLQDAVSW